jgi:hypothetical protein
VASARDLELEDDELAFYFASEAGIEASDLGQFLQRAAAVARQAGAELRVTALEPGSLSVIMKAVRSSKAGRAAVKEFNKAPIQVTAAGAALAGTVATAIAFAMSPDEAGVTPLGKAGATVIEHHHVERIEVVTTRETIIIMDPVRARGLRALEEQMRRETPLLPAPDVRVLTDQSRRGVLTGSVHEVAGELHFRPDGYRYLVPIDMAGSDAAASLQAGAHVRVSGKLHLHRGQPHAISIGDATRI